MTVMIHEFHHEIVGDVPRPWTESWGSLWLWAGGHLVGTPYETEMVKTGFDSLQDVASANRARASHILSQCSPTEALEAVRWARYGEGDSSRLKTLVVDAGCLFPLELLPSSTGPFFDGWEAILLEEGKTERLIYRQRGVLSPKQSGRQGRFATL